MPQPLGWCKANAGGAQKVKNGSTTCSDVVKDDMGQGCPRTRDCPKRNGACPKGLCTREVLHLGGVPAAIRDGDQARYATWPYANAPASTPMESPVC
ncbi:hypothetical protein V6N13_043616 [Hibiscus sabdariffa]|uniref:Uncharacterized protein n=1 Tax=Hibiscus sabdariffa TaxID=183260 RepID=A0ABR2RFN7_9ROSI